MGTTLITVCADRSFAARLNDYLRANWRGARCDAYIAAVDAAEAGDALESAPGGRTAVLLAEKDLLDSVRDEIMRFRRTFPAKYTDYRFAVLTPEEDDPGAAEGEIRRIFMYDRPSAILSAVERFAEAEEARTGVVSVFSPDGIAGAMFEPGGIHDWLSEGGSRLRLVSTDEYMRGPLWDRSGDGFLRLLCDAKSRRLRDFESYSSESRVISAEGSAPDVYELGGDEADAAAEMICSEWDGITLILLSSAASALNLRILERSGRIVYLGDLAPAERVFGRYFSGESAAVMEKIRFIRSEELAQCRRTGEWDAVWAHV